MKIIATASTWLWEEDLLHYQHSLQDVATRWNSVHWIVKWVLEQQLLYNPLRAEERFRCRVFRNGEVRWNHEASGRHYRGNWKVGETFCINFMSQFGLLTPENRSKGNEISIASRPHSASHWRISLPISKAVFLDPSMDVLSFLSPLEKEKLRAAIEEEACSYCMRIHWGE